MHSVAFVRFVKCSKRLEFDLMASHCLGSMHSNTTHTESNYSALRTGSALRSRSRSIYALSSSHGDDQAKTIPSSRYSRQINSWTNWAQHAHISRGMVC